MKTARRGFLKTLAAAPLAPAAAPLTPVASATAPPGPAPGSVAEALAEAARREFGAHLDERGLAVVKEEIARALGRASRLREAARLANADEPVNRFEARPPAAGTGERS